MLGALTVQREVVHVCPFNIVSTFFLFALPDAHPQVPHLRIKGKNLWAMISAGSCGGASRINFKFSGCVTPTYYTVFSFMNYEFTIQILVKVFNEVISI
jgi:hypothetical protein